MGTIVNDGAAFRRHISAANDLVKKTIGEKPPQQPQPPQQPGEAKK